MAYIFAEPASAELADSQKNFEEKYAADPKVSFCIFLRRRIFALI